jgi:hypothetical protein
VRFVPTKEASLRSARLRLAPRKLASLSVAPCKSASLRSAWLKLARLRFAQRRLATRRPAPRRSGWISRCCCRQRFHAATSCLTKASCSWFAMGFFLASSFLRQLCVRAWKSLLCRSVQSVKGGISATGSVSLCSSGQARHIGAPTFSGTLQTIVSRLLPQSAYHQLLQRHFQGDTRSEVA